MTKTEAIKAMTQGKKVTHVDFIGSCYFILKDGIFMNNDGNTRDMNRNRNDGWSIWVEPKHYVCFMRAWEHMENGGEAELKSECIKYKIHDNRMMTIGGMAALFSTTKVNGEWCLIKKYD